MNRALVIGGEGYIGRRLAARLAGEKWEVTVLAHPSGRSRQRLPIGVQRVGGDRSDPLVIRDLAAHHPDVIFDLIAYNPADTEALVQEGKGKLRASGSLEHGPLCTGSFPETAPATEVRAKRFENGERGYGPEKAACERVLERGGVPYVIIRSAPIIGPEDPCSRENYFLKRIRARQTILHPGPEHGFLWLLFVDDLVDAFVRAATAPALGLAFHLANEDAPTLHEHVNALAANRTAMRPEIRVTSPDHLRQHGLSLYGFPYARTIPVRPDTSAARRALGWQPRSYRHALTETIAALQDPERASPSWPGRNATQALLAGTHEWLHADIEVRVLADLPTSAGPDPDKVLSWLSDDPGESPHVSFVESEEWPSRSSVANSDERFVTIPRN